MDLLRRHLAVHLDDLFVRVRVVVWHDDSGTLGPILRQVLPVGVEMPAFEGNPLSLRQKIDADPWLEGRWLLYIPPLPSGVECEWLVDYEQAFCHLPRANLAWALHKFFNLLETPLVRDLLRGDAAARIAAAFDR